MAVSGTNTFNVTRNDIIKSSMRTLGVLGLGEEPETEDYTNCSQALNIMIKSWAKKGFPLWVYQNVTIPMIDGLEVYPLGPTAGYVHSVDIVSGGTGYAASGTVTFTGGGGSLAAGTYTSTGGVIDSITITVAGSGYTSAPTVSFSDGGSGASGTAIIAGVTMSRPLRIMNAFIRNPESDDTVLTIISQQEYNMLGIKTSPGIPNQIYYDNQLINGLLYPYNVQSGDDYEIHILVQRMFYDMTTGTDDFDFPKEWFQALKWGLCSELAEEYGVEADKIARIQMRAEQYLMECSDWSQEEASVYFTMDFRGTGSGARSP